MIWCDGLFTVPANQTFVEDSDVIFHWFLAAELPEAGFNSPKDGCLGRYRRHSVRFATQNVRDVALINLNLSELADVALACLDSSKSSTRYWVEVLACKCLQMGQLKLPAALLPEGCKERVRFELSVPIATLQQQASPQEAATLCKSDMPVLCLLHAGNEPAIDAISDPSLYREVTKAERDNVLSDAMAKMDKATAQVEGGRKAQLLALQGSVTWIDAPVPLSMPLRCFFMPPRHFDVMWKSKQPYTESGKPSQAQGPHSPESEVAHHCVVRLPLETILRECRDIVAAAKFERLVEELYDEDPGEAMGICAMYDAKR